MVTSTHRWIADPSLAFLPTPGDHREGSTSPATSPIASGCSTRRASAATSTGDPEAILALQTNPVHYYQRPDADPPRPRRAATSSAGHGGSVRFGRSGTRRFRATDHFHWYSPGLELNDIGYLRQADLKANQVFLGWAETKPKGIFRELRVPGVAGGPVGLRRPPTRAADGVDANAAFKNKWGVTARRLRGGRRHARAPRRPRAALHDFFEATPPGRTDQSRRVSASPCAAGSWTLDDDSRPRPVGRGLGCAPRTGCRSRDRPVRAADDDLQYVATAEADRRHALGARPHRPGHLELHVPGQPLDHPGPDASSTTAVPSSPRGGTPRSARPTDTPGAGQREPVPRSTARTRSPTPRRATSTEVTKRRRPELRLGNPDFSFRQFRSNLVARWEWKPGSSLYVVWSAGTHRHARAWDDSFALQLGRAWEHAAGQRLSHQAELLVLAVTGGESTWRSRAAARPTAGTPLPADA